MLEVRVLPRQPAEGVTSLGHHGLMLDVLRLGRSVVVGPGQRPPADWADCERRVVDVVDAGLAEELHGAWRERQPLVLELTPGIGLDDPAVAPPDTVPPGQPWEWSVDLELPGERLHHAVWANSADGRDPEHLRWRWADQAVRAGARPAAAGRADVILADGRPAICDGGPIDAGLADRCGLAVLHRISIEHRSVQPLGSPPVPATVDLAPDQRAAVDERRAGARILAPAGSGKTRVLTERARAMVGTWQVPPEALALIAYNVRAAAEMRERLEDVEGLRIRTLNALGLRLCGRQTTLEETEVRRILSGLVAFPRRAETDPAAPWIEALSRVRLSLAAPADVEDELGDVSDLARVATAFRSELAARDAVDFDEQVVGAIARLLGDPVFRARSQRFARILLVDEFQDLTPSHMLLIRLLSGPAGAVFAVGDDDQTIYGYAGATPRWLVDYERWFPGSSVHTLEVNYRCPPAVITAATNLLSRNAVRVTKAVRPADGASGELELLAAGPGPAARTADRVEALLSEGASTGDIAVLSRVNASLVPVHVLLGHRGVAVDAAGDRRFLQRGGVRGALAWLEVAAAPEGRLPGAALREAARRPKRGMSNGLLELLGRPRSMDSLEGLSTWLETKGSSRDADKVDRLVRDVALVRTAARRGTARVLQVVRQQVGGEGLDASASALDMWSHGAIAAHADDLDALSELAALEPDPARFAGWLAERLGDPAVAGGVTLASVHAVKGREWPHVILHHVSDGLIPHRLSGDLEEERRIFHVGLTRGRRSVTVVPGPDPSPFLEELRAPGRPGPGPGPARDQERGRPGTGRGAGSTTGARTSTEIGGRQGRNAGGSATGPQELVPATAGAVFTLGGQEHEVVEVADQGAICLVGGGPARTVIRFGTTVNWAGRRAILAHPSAERAWEVLRSWRGEKARALKTPAYVVFDDATLRLVAAHLPTTEAGLLALKGIGPVKLESYGSELLALTDELRSG
jgi:ATP-dependent DNA helicase UvrD/PcrA